MAQFTRVIPDDQVMLLLEALAWYYGGYNPKINQGQEDGSIIEIDNPMSLSEWVGDKVDEGWKNIVKQYQEEKIRKQVEQEVADRVINIDITQ